MLTRGIARNRDCIPFAFSSRCRRPAACAPVVALAEDVNVADVFAGGRSVAEKRAPDVQPLQLKVEREAQETSPLSIQTIQKYDWADIDNNVKYVCGLPSVHSLLSKQRAT